MRINKRYHEDTTRSNALFKRRRCPGCGSGAYKRLTQAVNPSLRKCNACGRVFHLFNKGVVEGGAPKPVAAKSGVIPVPCRGREFKPLTRDPFAFMRLAMVTRG